MSMNISTSHQGASTPNLNSYLKFAAAPDNHDKVVVGANGNKIQIASKGPDTSNLSSYIADNGLEFELSQQEKSAVVDHFKQALRLKYGEDARYFFSSTQEREALAHGLSHCIVKNVTEGATQHDAQCAILKIEDACQTLDTLDQSHPFFRREMALENAREDMQQAKKILNENASLSAELSTKLHEKIQKLETSIQQAESRFFQPKSQSSSVFSPIPQSSSNKTAVDFGEEFRKAHAANFAKLDAQQGKKSTAATATKKEAPAPGGAGRFRPRGF